MPPAQGRTSNNIKKVASRKKSSLLKGSFSESKKKQLSEERQISALVFGNTEQSRCIVFALFAPELEAYCTLATLLQPLQAPEERNHSHSTAIADSPPTIVFLINLNEEHKTDLSDNKCCPQSSSACTSSRMNTIPGESHNRNKRAKSLKDSSNSSAITCSILDTSSGSTCDSSSPLSSDDFVSDISKVTPLKRSSKKKAKKKGKHYRKAISKKHSTDLEGDFGGSSCSVSILETSAGHSLTCSDAQILDDLAENASCPPSTETNNSAESSMTMLSCISYDDEIEKLEAMNSPSMGVGYDELNNNSRNDFTSKSSIQHLSDGAPLTVRSSSLIRSSKRNGNLSIISVDLSDDETMVSSFPDQCGSDASNNCSDSVKTRLPLSVGEDSDSMKNMVASVSKKFESASRRSVVDSVVKNRGVSVDRASSDSQCLGDLHADISSERAECSSQACGGNDFLPVLSGKRSMVSRKLSVHSGKDNNHPVWQKVQKVATRHCIGKPKTLCTVPPKEDGRSKEHGQRVTPSALSGFNQKAKSTKHRYSYEVVSETSKSTDVMDRMKPTSVPKQGSQHSRKVIHNVSTNFSKPSKFNVQQEKESTKLPQVNHDEQSCGRSSLCYTDSTLPMVKLTDKSLFCPLTTQEQTEEEHVDNATSCAETSSTIGDMSHCSRVDFLDQSHEIDTKTSDNSDCRVGDMQSHLDLMDITNNQYKILPAEQCSVDYRETNDNSGPVLQKWVPVGRKDAAVCHIVRAKSDAEPISYMESCEHTEVDVNSGVKSSIPSCGTETQGFGPCGDDTGSSSEADVLNDSLMTCLPTGENFSVDDEVHLQFADEVKHIQSFKTDLDKILDATDDACKLQGFHQVAGSPFADFEKFLCSASPVISQRLSNGICLICSGQRQSGSLCLHQIRNVTLGSLWQWYEEPGCYGLEVKTENNLKSKRLPDGLAEFRAYFVPYLSAVQLFGQSTSNYSCSRGNVAVFCEVTPSPLSDLGSLPIQHHKEVDSCFSESALPARDVLCYQSFTQRNLNDGNLIFEYFEQAHPPQRRPLFEKINELVSDDGPPNSIMYGDPLKLEFSSLHELHPASWYAVAWYPIYRIPEGNFRAAFLTYHSLGHFIYRSAPLETAGDFIHIVSPVVGLQSYNAKKECWFRPKQMWSAETEKEDSSSKLLEERLRTLEHTAFVMSTATVFKDDKVFVNNHPDYNHFASRL